MIHEEKCPLGFMPKWKSPRHGWNQRLRERTGWKGKVNTLTSVDCECGNIVARDVHLWGLFKGLEGSKVRRVSLKCVVLKVIFF